MKRRERWVVLLMASCHTLVHCYEQIFPALLPALLVYFQFKLKTAGWMQNLLALAFGLGALPAGYIADRFGPRRIIVVYLLGAAFSSLFIAASRSIAGLALGLAAMGAFISLYHPAGTTLITTEVKQDLGKALGYHGMGGGLGLATVPALATLPTAFFPENGWRISFAAFGLLGLLAAVGVAKLRVSETQARDNRGRFWPERIAKDSSTPLYLFLFVAVVMGFCYRGVTTYLPTYFVENLNGGIFEGSDVLKGGTFATLTLIVGVAGQFVGGHLTGRFKLERLFAAMMLVTVPLLLLMSVLTDYALFFVTMAFAFFHFSSQPVGNNLVAEYTDPRGRGLGFGLYFSAAFGFGSFASGFSGMVADRFGLNEVFLALAGVVLVGFVAMVYLARTQSRKVREQEG
ncbi:MAG: MFS transporter [Candidatus Abyssubacteria bacterium]